MTVAPFPPADQFAAAQASWFRACAKDRRRCAEMLGRAGMPEGARKQLCLADKDDAAARWWDSRAASGQVPLAIAAE